MRRLTRTDYRQQPWKNGAGVTLELAVSPPGAGLDGFDWRISRARVGADGPFSAYPGVDRSLALLSGAGLRLACDGFTPFTLPADGTIWRFAGERPVSATLVDGMAVEDFNVMTRRGRVAQQVSQQQLTSGAALTLPTEPGATRIVHLVSGRLSGRNGAEPLHLEADDSLVLAPGEAAPLLRADAPCRLFVIILLPQGDYA